jgi:hypothetical protein
MQAGLGFVKTTEATCSLASKEHHLALRWINALPMQPTKPWLAMLTWPGAKEDVLFCLPCELTEPVA